jgi:sterol 3beta-glucosyltransferase
MKICMLAAGSRGDTQPLIALGVELQKLGHVITIAGSVGFKDLIESYGIQFHPIGGDIQSRVLQSDLQKVMQADSPLKIIFSFKTVMKYAAEMQSGFYRACEAADAVVFHPGASIGYYAARKLGIPSVLASPFPMALTKDFPSLVFYDSVRLGKAVNRLSHKLFEQIMWMPIGSPVKRYWKDNFRGIPSNLANPFVKIRENDELNVMSLSRQIFPRPTDWPSNTLSEGYWFLNEPRDWQAPSALIDFLSSGPAPVYIGFGSMMNPAIAEQTTKILIQALAMAGKRGVLATGWGAISSATKIPSSIFMLESAPHSWLFPRMTTIVHHGGAGTTAECFRSGVPSVVIPHALDQFAWARRTEELGVGAHPIAKKKLTAERLAKAILECDDSELRNRAKALGQKIRAEQGATACAQVISEFFKTALVSS